MDLEFANGSKEAVAALLFLAGGQYTMSAFSSLNSSPWTSENFGADATKAASCREYVKHAIIVSGAAAIVASTVAHSLWPIIGTLIIDAYMWWLYERALMRGSAAGSKGWPNG